MKPRVRNLFLMTETLLIFMALVPHPIFAARTATISVNPTSGVITYPTYTINIIISPVSNLNMIHFILSFNDGVDFLDVQTGNVEPGDLFAGITTERSIGIYSLSSTGLSYVNVLIEMSGNETVTNTEPKSIAKITFKLLPNAMPDMTSWLKLEEADAWFYADGTFEYIDEKSGITLQSGTVTVDYLVTNLTVDPATATVEKPVALSSTLKDGGGNPIAGLSVDYYVDSVPIGSALTNDFGVSSTLYTPQNVGTGTSTIEAQYVGNQPGGKYASSSGTAPLTINKMSTTLSLSLQSSIKVGDAVDLAAALKKDGNPIGAGFTVSFYIRPSIGSWDLIGSPTTNSSGVAVVVPKYTFSSPDTYEIKAEFSGTANYAPSMDTTTRTVAMQRTSIKLTITPTITPKVDQQITLSATLKNDVGGNLIPPSGRIIEFYVNSQLIGSAITDINGVASKTYTPQEASPPEGWKVEARYGGDSTYSSSVDTVTIVVNKLATTLYPFSVAPSTIAIEQTVIMTATLKDENTKAVSNANIDYYVKVENRWTKIDTATTDENGIASLDYAPTVTGVLLIKANYTGSSKYLSSNSEPTIITVNKLTTTLTLSMPTTAKVEEIIMISVTLKDANQKTIPTVTINYTLLIPSQEQAIGSAKTDQNGVASIPYALINVGTFQIKATYSGSTKYVDSSASQALTVSALRTSLSLNTPITARVGDTVGLVAILKDENQKAIEGLGVEYSIYSSGAWNPIGTAVTNSSGVATRSYTPSEAGTFRFSAKFREYGKYANTTSQEVTLTVRKVQTTLAISLSNTTMPVQTSCIIWATLKDEDTQLMARASISYEIFNETWIGIGSMTTNLHGVASLSFSAPSKAGTLRLRAVYAGDSKYAESTSQEANLVVTGGASPPPPPPPPPEWNPLDFLLDNQLTVLDLLFWGVIILALATIVGVSIWRKIKSTERQKSAIYRPK